MRNRLPAWFKQEIPDKEVFVVNRLLEGLGLETVCAQAHCPNLNRCFKQGHLTFLILGPVCTRTCRFCAVKKSKIPSPADPDEPERIAAAAKIMGLNFVVVTSVTRDDLADEGAEAFCQTVAHLRSLSPAPGIELLIPDFSGKLANIEKVVRSAPQVIGHNLETVNELYPRLKPDSDYRISLEVLRSIKRINPLQVTKSGLMLGLGETSEQVSVALNGLRSCQCDLLTIGQYLAPSKAHYPVREFVSPQKFAEHREIALGLGFKGVSCGPLVRSSFDAGQLYGELAHA